MRNIARRLPVWVAGTALGAGAVIVAPGMSAFACGAENPVAVSAGSTEGSAPTAETTPFGGSTPGGAAPGAVTPAPVKVSAHPGSLVLPAGGSATFTVKVAHGRPGLTGQLEIRTSATDPQGLAPVSIDMFSAGGWKKLPSEGAMGRQWFTADGLTFRTGRTAFRFRVHVWAGATVGQQVAFRAEVSDAAGVRLASVQIDGAITGVKPRLRTSFPDRLRRGGLYRQFDVTVSNPSTASLQRVTVDLAFTHAPPGGRGYLLARDVRLDQRVGGAWTRSALRDGDCDPGISAKLGGPFDLGPKESRKLHLRIRLTDSTPAALSAGDYFISAGAGQTENRPVISGRFAIEPQRPSGGSGQPRGTTPTAIGDPAKPGGHTQPAATNRDQSGAPTRLAHTGAAVVPLVGGVVLLLSGLGVVALAHRRRRAAGV